MAVKWSLVWLEKEKLHSHIQEREIGWLWELQAGEEEEAPSRGTWTCLKTGHMIIKVQQGQLKSAALGLRQFHTWVQRGRGTQSRPMEKDLWVLMHEKQPARSTVTFSTSREMRWAERGRWLYPSTLPSWGLIWSNVSRPGALNTRRMQSCWRESRGETLRSKGLDNLSNEERLRELSLLIGEVSWEFSLLPSSTWRDLTTRMDF